MSVTTLQSRDLTNAAAASERIAEGRFRESEPWNQENFAREQIRGLVRQVFFSTAAQPVRQVVFTAADPQTDVGSICRQVGETLSQETRGTIAVVSGDVSILRGIEPYHEPETAGSGCSESNIQRQSAIRVRRNLWFVPQTAVPGESHGLVRESSWYLRLCDLRREFEFSVVHGPPALASGNAVGLGQVADGVILVLSAGGTRRAAARKIKDTLEVAQVRVLGAVLSDRTFPVPEKIYRHL